MFTFTTPRSNRYLLTPRNDFRITSRVIFPVSSTKNSDQLTRNISIPRSKLLSDSLSKTQKLQKSLDTLRVKKQETERVFSKFTENHLKKLRAKVDIMKVNLKFHRAALLIQKNFRGFLIRRKYRPVISSQLKKTLQVGIQNLKVRVEDIWSQTESLNRSAKMIQLKFREFLRKKKEKINKKVQIFYEKNSKISAARRIQRFFRDMVNRVKFRRILEKLEKVKKNLRFIRVKILWDSRKFNWKTMRKHYGVQDEDSENIAIVVITPTSTAPVRVDVKYKKKTKKNKRNKIKAKNVKSNLATSSSVLSPKPESENFNESAGNDRADNTLNSEEETKNQLGIPFDRIKKMFNDLDLEESDKNELLNEIEETSIYKNTPTPVLSNVLTKNTPTPVLEKVKTHHKASSSVPSKGSMSKRAENITVRMKKVSKRKIPIPLK